MSRLILGLTFLSECIKVQYNKRSGRKKYRFLYGKMRRKIRQDKVASKLRRETGFTLLELLIVVAVIAILSGVATVNFLQATGRAKRAAAKSFMAQLETAISMYKIDTGHYPPDERGSASLREALSPAPEDPIWEDPEWTGPYLEFKKSEVNEAGELLDPWHKGRNDRVHIYFYAADLDGIPFTSPPFHNKSSYDIYSKGSDGKTGSSGVDGDEFEDGDYCQNEIDDDEDGVIDELNPNGPGSSDGYLEDDINNW